MSDWCKSCDGFMLRPSEHRCPPAWLVWREDETEEDATTVHASSAESAAEEWAEDDDRNSADYAIVGGDEARVWVKSLEPERVKALGDDPGPIFFEVTGESIPSYNAYKSKPKTAPPLAAAVDCASGEQP